LRENRLRKRWAEQQPALGGWLTVPSGISAEILAHAGFDWLCVDMQHGLIDYAQMVQMLQAMSYTGVTPVVRVPWNEPGIIGKCLDAGALAIVVPMVNSRADAEAAARACRYAPVGARSYGPLRANYWAGSDYFSEANRLVCCVVMVETAAAVEAVEDIVSVDGVDAVYIGPADLSVSLGLPPAPDHVEEVFTAALSRIVAACRRHGVAPGIAGNPTTAPKRVAEGFAMVEVASDSGLLASGAATALSLLRPRDGAAGESTAYL